MTPYSLTDIEQYLRGELSPAGMHAIEKAALQDPFLADAIEGYRSAGIVTVNEDLSSIHDQLHITKETTVVTGRSVAIKSIAWLQVAASVILVAGATTLGWVFLKNDTKENKQVQVVASIKKKGTVEKDIVVVLAKKAPAKIQSTQTAPEAEFVAVPKTKGYDTTITRREILDIKLREAPLKKTLNIAFKKDVESERKYDTTVKRIETAEYRVKNISPAGSVCADTASFVVNVTTVNSTKITHDEIESPLYDVVVVGKGTYFPPAISTHIAWPSIKTSPVAGWPEFNRYLSEKLSLVQSDMKAAYDSISVMVNIDKSGKVLYAGISRSFNNSLNDRICKAISQGPAWLNLSGRKETFSIIISVYR